MHKSTYLCAFFKTKCAQVAESVDALVSNTSGAIRAGSTPALGTKENGFPIYFESHFLFSYKAAIPPSYRFRGYPTRNTE